MEGYKGLKVYEKSYKLALNVYEITKLLPNEERYGLISQMKRASSSVPINIAEGYGRKQNVMDYRQFLIIAQGSANEMQVLLDFCKDLKYISTDKHQELYNGYTEILKMLHGLIKACSK